MFSPKLGLNLLLSITDTQPERHLLVMRVREHVVFDLVRQGEAQVTLAKHGFGLALWLLAKKEG